MRDVIATDLDGVLAAPPPESSIPWRHMNGLQRAERRRQLLDWYKQAEVWFRPSCQFHVITARKRDPLVRVVTEDWLRAAFGDQVLSVRMLDTSRNLENNIVFKAGVLHGLPEVPMYIDDTLPLLRGLRKAGVPQSLWRYRNGAITPL